MVNARFFVYNRENCHTDVMTILGDHEYLLLLCEMEVHFKDYAE